MAAVSTATPSLTMNEMDNVATGAAVERVRRMDDLRRGERLEPLLVRTELLDAAAFQFHRRPQRSWWQRNGSAQTLVLIAIMIAVVGAIVSTITLNA
jgi:hypothetical protein